MEWLNEIAGDLAFAVRILLIILGLILVRWVLLVIIKRIVTTVTTGVKKREGVADTKALDASPLARARMVQQVRPSKKDAITRALRMEAKKALDKAGVKLSTPEGKTRAARK